MSDKCVRNQLARTYGAKVHLAGRNSHFTMHIRGLGAFVLALDWHQASAMKSNFIAQAGWGFFNAKSSAKAHRGFWPLVDLRAQWLRGAAPAARAD